MPDRVWKRDEIASPCVQICVIHRESGLCTGCLRTLDEIAGWSGYTDAERARLMAELPARKPMLNRRRGGRAGRVRRGETGEPGET